jgi:hypothetical protein
VDRDAAVASPWTVKPAIAKRYGVDSIMPEETRKGVESIKKGEIDKRKKVWEDKDGPPSKKHKKMTPAQEEKGTRFQEFQTISDFASLQSDANKKLARRLSRPIMPSRRLNAWRSRRKSPFGTQPKILTSGSEKETRRLV